MWAHIERKTEENNLPKLSPHNADDIKCDTNHISPNGKCPAIIIVCTVFFEGVFFDGVYLWFDNTLH